MFAPFDARYHAPDGEYVGMYVHPRPFQQPHPPVWLMSNTPATYELAGKRGMNVVGVTGATDNIQACWSAYQKATMARTGTEIALGSGVSLCVAIYVADTMEQAARDVRASINGYSEFVVGARPSGRDRTSFLNAGEELTPQARDSDWFDFLSSRDLIWVGTPDHVAEKIEQYRTDLGLDHLMLLQQFPGMPFEKILANLSRFGEHVAPRF